MVLWQWIALLGQIAAIFSIGRMVDCILMHQMSNQVILTTFMVLVVAVAIRFLCDQMATRASFAARDRKSTRLNSSHTDSSRMPSSA